MAIIPVSSGYGSGSKRKESKGGMANPNPNQRPRPLSSSSSKSSKSSRFDAESEAQGEESEREASNQTKSRSKSRPSSSGTSTSSSSRKSLVKLIHKETYGSGMEMESERSSFLRMDSAEIENESMLQKQTQSQKDMELEEEGNLIQRWSSVKRKIESLLSGSANNPNNLFPITLQHGFQPTQTMISLGSQRAQVKGVLYIPPPSTGSTSNRANSSPNSSAQGNFVVLEGGNGNGSNGSSSSATTPSISNGPGISVWKGTRRMKRHPILLSNAPSQKDSSSTGIKSSMSKGGSKNSSLFTSQVSQRNQMLSKGPLEAFTGFTNWVHIPSLSLYIIATLQLELKVLDPTSFNVQSITGTDKAVLCMEWIERLKILIIGQIGGISTYKLVNLSENNGKANLIGHPVIYTLVQVLSIEDPIRDDWITCFHFDLSREAIVAGCGTSLQVFSIDDGSLLDTYLNIHTLSITCITFYEPSELLITGSKDGSIKVFNVRKSLLFEFREHCDSVSGFILLESLCSNGAAANGDVLGGGGGVAWGSLPILVSASLDATIRLWNIETGHALSRIDTNSPCLGLNPLPSVHGKQNSFYHYTINSIQVWNVNRFQFTFTELGSRTDILKFVPTSSSGAAARVVAAVADGSLRLISPITGSILGTGFPADKEIALHQLEYENEREILYGLGKSGSLVVYDTSVNPFKIKGIMNTSGISGPAGSSQSQKSSGGGWDRISCICGANFSSYIHGLDRDIDKRLYQASSTLVTSYLLFGGGDSGQIYLMRPTELKEKQVSIIQAHSARITMLHYDFKNVRLISGGSDGLIKVWNIAIENKKTVAGIGKEEGNKAIITHLTLHSTLNIESFDNLPSPSYCICSETQQIGMHCNGELHVASYGKNQILKPTIVDSHEHAQILSIVCTKNASLWAASFNDSTIKVWDSHSVLIREIQFNDPISSLCFANERGDLLVGQSSEITLVRIQDYMTPPFLKKIILNNYQDEKEEFPLNFDQHLEFWDYPKEEEVEQIEKVDLNDTISKFTKKNERKRTNNQRHEVDVNKPMSIDEMDFDQLIALSQNRRAEADQRRHRREFLELEKEIYNREVKKKIEATVQHLIPLNENIPEVVVVEEKKPEMTAAQKALHELDKKYGLVGIGNSVHNLLSKDPNPFAKPQRTITGSRRSLLLNRRRSSRRKSSMKPDDQLQPKLKIIRDQTELTEDDGKEWFRPTNNIAEEDEEMDEDSLEENSSDDGEDDDDDEEEEMEIVPMKMPHFFPDELKSREELHNNLMDVSAKALEISVVAQHDTLEKKKKDVLDKKAAAKIKDKGIAYADGMELPNSVGIAGLLPKRRGSKFLSRTNQLFQKVNQVEMYLDKDDIDGEEVPKPRPKFAIRPKEVEEDTIEEVFQEENPVLVNQPEPEAEEDEEEAPPPKPKELPPIIVDLTVDDDEEPVQEEIKPATPPPPPPPVVKPKKIKKKVVKKEKSIEFVPIPNEKPILNLETMGDEATKKLIKLHGLEDLPKPKTSKKKRVGSASSKEEDGPNIKVAKKKATVAPQLPTTTPAIKPTTPPAPLPVLNKAPAVFEPRKFVKTTPSLPPPPAAIEARVAPKPYIHPPARKASVITLEKPAIDFKTSFPKGQLKEHTSAKLPELDVDSAKPILELLSSTQTPMDASLSIEAMIALIIVQLKSRNTTKCIIALKALVAIHLMFKDDILEEKIFDFFVAPLLDTFQTDDRIVRGVVVRSFVEMEIRHDNVLMLLVCALNERDRIIVQDAIKGLSAYGIADKEGLKRAMIELGMIQGRVVYSSNEKLDQLAEKIRMDHDKQRQERTRLINTWIQTTEEVREELNLARNDSYIDHLAGRYYPPDAHDFDGIQRAMAMAAESNANYDQFWRQKFLDPIDQNERGDTSTTNPSRRASSSGGHRSILFPLQIRKLSTFEAAGRGGQKLMASYNIVMTRAINGGSGSIGNPSRPSTSNKPKTPASTALAVTRAMTRGFIKVDPVANLNSHLPKINNRASFDARNRPRTSHIDTSGETRKSSSSIKIPFSSQEEVGRSPSSENVHTTRQRPHTTAAVVEFNSSGSIHGTGTEGSQYEL